MTNNQLVGTGVAGTVIAALCCFTPLLVIALGGLGFAWLTPYLDWFLLPFLALCLLLFAYGVRGLWLRRRFHRLHSTTST